MNTKVNVDEQSIVTQERGVLKEEPPTLTMKMAWVLSVDLMEGLTTVHVTLTEKTAGIYQCKINK